MIVEKREKSYLILFSQGKKLQRTSVVGVRSDKEIVELVRKTFKGRFKRPEALTMRDGVRIIVKCLDHIKNQTTQVFNSRIFNKSVTQARLMIEQAIKDN